jgi:hypothetical protein
MRVMSRTDIEIWARRFIADMAPGGIPVPLRRIMKRHFAEIRHLRELGLTWKAIAQCLDRVGGEDPHYRPVSADLLRSNFARLDKDPGLRRASGGMSDGLNYRSHLTGTAQIVVGRFEKS